jgi:hypothetical protein
MIEHNNEKQNEETNFIGKTRFYDKDGNIVESLNQEGKVLVINFPGSGMTFNGKDEDSVKKSAVETCEATQRLLPQNKELLSQAFVCTAVYENKADKAIKEYNEENNNTHSNEIFEQILKPMIIEGDYDKTLDNLSRVIFRGHCFGCMVIAELENLLETKLKEQFNEVQCKNLLSAPQAFISSPALQLDKYPKYFQTTAIVNNSDRTITGKDYCGDRLKQDLRELAGFDEKDLISLDARDTMEILKSLNARENKEVIYIQDVPDIKISEKQQNNVHFIISNRAELPSKYDKMKESIEKRIGTKENGDPEYDAKYRKQVKKNIGGHEYFFLPDELKSKFSTSFRNAFEKCQTRIKIRDIRKRQHNSNIDSLVQLQENKETLTKENKLQIGKTGNSSTGEISDIHKQTAKIQICSKSQRF